MGKSVPAVDAYVDHGRVTITGSIDEARQRLVEDWWAVHRDHTTAILAVRRVDVRVLNEMVRDHRKANGELGEEIRVGEKTFSMGDRVIFEQNQRVRRQDQRPLEQPSGSATVPLPPWSASPIRPQPENQAVTREGDVARVRG